jgi:cytochrome c biogenesis protein CcdA
MEDIKHNKSSKTSALYVIMGITVILILVALLSSGITQFTGGQASTFVTVSFMAAFIGGFLSLISPCSAAMLPVFFAYSFKQKSELLKMTFIFYLGLATVFVPLGFASTLISKLFVEYPQLLFNIAGTIFIFLGIMLFFGKSFQVLPKKWRVAPQGKGAGTIYVMGILFAFATGTCAAPIIGGIYTIAATSGNAIQGVALLLVYALGLVGPMFLMAWFFDRFNCTNSKFVQSKSWDLRLAGKTFHLHTTNLIAATLFYWCGTFIYT